jgi:hypothetical protein
MTILISQMPVDLRRRIFGYVRHPLAMLFVSTPREPLYHVRAEPMSHYLRCYRYDLAVEAADAQMEIELQEHLASLLARSDEWLVEMGVILQTDLATDPNGPLGSFLNIRIFVSITMLQSARVARRKNSFLTPT